MPTSRRQKLILTAAMVLIILAGLLTGLWLYLPRYVEATLIPELGRKLGLETREAAVRRIGFAGIDIGPVTLALGDQSALAVKTLRIDYSLQTLLHKKLTAIALIGLRVRCDIDGSRVVLAGIPLTPGEPDDGATAAPINPAALIPVTIERLSVREAVLDLYSRDRHLAVPVALEMNTAALAQGRAEITAAVGSRKTALKLALNLDATANTVTAELNKLVLDLADAADIAGLTDATALTAVGILQGSGSATIDLSSFAVQAMHFDAGLEAAALSTGDIRLENAAQDSGGKTAIKILADAEKPETIDWRVGPFALTAPARVRIDTLQGRLQTQNAAATLAARCRATVPSQSFKADGQELALLEPVSMEWVVSAMVDLQGETVFNLKPADPGNQPAAVWRGKGVKASHTIANLFVGGKHTPAATTATFGLLLKNNSVNTDTAVLAFPSLEVEGSLEMGDKVQAQADIRLAGASAQARDIIAKAASAGLDVRLDQTADNGWRANGKAFVEKVEAADRKQGVAMQAISAVLPFQWPPNTQTPAGRLTVKSIRWKGRPVGTVAGGLRQKNDGIVFDLRHDSKLFPGLFVLIKGDAGKDGAVVSAELPAYRTPHDINLGRLAPAADGFTFGGLLSANGQAVVKTDGSLSGKGIFKLENGRLKHADQKLEATGIYTQFAIDDLMSLTGPPNQRLGFASLSLGNIKTGAMEMFFQMPGNQSVLIEKSLLHWCRGTVETEPLRLSAGMKAMDAVLVCKDLDLAMMLKQLGAAEGDGDAVVSGRIPIGWSKGRLRFEKGFLSSPKGKSGIIRLRSLGGGEHLLEGLPPDTPQRIQIDIAREALKDYTYHGIQLFLENEKDVLLMTMRLNGKPNQLLPFSYDKELGQFKRVQGQGVADFKGVDIDLNLRSPLDEILNYKDLLKRTER